MARMRGASPKHATQTPPRLNSLEWISRFVARLLLLHPAAPLPRAVWLAVNACSEMHEGSPERAALHVVQREVGHVPGLKLDSENPKTRT